MLRKARHTFFLKPQFFRCLTFSEYCSSHHFLMTRSVQLNKTGRTQRSPHSMSLLLVPLGKEDFADGVKANKVPLKCQSTSDSDTSTNITSLPALLSQPQNFWEHHSEYAVNKHNKKFHQCIIYKTFSIFSLKFISKYTLQIWGLKVKFSGAKLPRWPFLLKRGRIWHLIHCLQFKWGLCTLDIDCFDD